MRSIISNLGDCFSYPGELTPGQAQRALAVHRLCSPNCLILQQAEQALGIEGRGGPSAELAPSDQIGKYPSIELIGYGEVSTGYLG
ncbi:hypothetical protein ACWEO2_16075 [Nocardia sp. NPDC004278]